MQIEKTLDVLKRFSRHVQTLALYYKKCPDMACARTIVGHCHNNAASVVRVLIKRHQEESVHSKRHVVCQNPGNNRNQHLARQNT